MNDFLNSQKTPRLRIPMHISNCTEISQNHEPGKWEPSLKDNELGIVLEKEDSSSYQKRDFFSR